MIKVHLQLQRELGGFRDGVGEVFFNPGWNPNYFIFMEKIRKNLEKNCLINLSPCKLQSFEHH